MTLRERISDRRAGGREVTDLATARMICNRMVAYYPSARYSVTNVVSFNGLGRVMGCKSLCLLRLGAEIVFGKGPSSAVMQSETRKRRHEQAKSAILNSQPLPPRAIVSIMKGEIQILAVELDGPDGLIATFSDGTTGGYVVEELLELRPVRERVKIKKVPNVPKAQVR